MYFFSASVISPPPGTQAVQLRWAPGRVDRRREVLVPTCGKPANGQRISMAVRKEPHAWVKSHMHESVRAPNTHDPVRAFHTQARSSLQHAGMTTFCPCGSCFFLLSSRNSKPGRRLCCRVLPFQPIPRKTNSGFQRV